jgi:hypothetical protein
MQSPEVVDALYAPVAKGRAEVGMLQSASTPENLAILRDRLGKTFGTAPLIQRVHGQGSCLHSGNAGFAIDSSVRPLFDLSSDGGCNYRAFPLHPYWLDEAQSLLELPLTATYWGMLRRQGGLVQPRIEHNPALCRAMERLGLLERIPLTPEGVSVEEAIRSIDMALDDGLPLLTFSAQAQSLTKSQDWWLRVLAYLQLRSVQSTSVREIMDKVIRN